MSCNIAWRNREVRRNVVPWIREPWYLASEYANLHFSFVSRVDSSMVAFTKSEEHGVDDRQTRIAPRKYLTRYFGDTLTANQVDVLVDQFNDQAIS